MVVVKEIVIIFKYMRSVVCCVWDLFLEWLNCVEVIGVVEVLYNLKLIIFII